VIVWWENRMTEITLRLDWWLFGLLTLWLFGRAVAWLSSYARSQGWRRR